MRFSWKNSQLLKFQQKNEVQLVETDLWPFRLKFVPNNSLTDSKKILIVNLCALTSYSYRLVCSCIYYHLSILHCDSIWFVKSIKMSAHPQQNEIKTSDKTIHNANQFQVDQYGYASCDFFSRNFWIQVHGQTKRLTVHFS